MAGIFEYGTDATDHIRRSDPVLGRIIDAVGPLRMPKDPDMFTALVRNIIGQQISIPVYERIWMDFVKMFGEGPEPSAVLTSGAEPLTSMGLTRKKTEYILGLAESFSDGTVDPHEIEEMDDDAAMAALDSLRGIGPWTAEMVLVFYLNRMDVFSFGDLALIRGIRRIYGLDDVSREQFEELRKRFSPYCSVAMLYIWEVGEGRVPPDVYV